MAKNKSKRGFAALTPERRRETARKGGKASAAGAGHKWTPEQAISMARKGGRASSKSDKAHRFTSQTAKAAAAARRRKGKRERG
jgi:general stress protein YciG